MQAADIPSKFDIPFANGAVPPYITPIPLAPQPAGRASLTDGFPQINFDPIASGGIPPAGADFNGILNQVSAWVRWTSAGGPVAYDGTFQTAIGGYPSGALILSATTAGLWWLSTADNNMTDPDAAGAGWTPVGTVKSARIVTASGAFSILVTDNFIGLRRQVSPAVSSATLPNEPFTGYEVVVEDLFANFNAFPVTITPAAGSIAGLTAVVLNQNRQSASFRHYGSNIWGAKL